MTDTTFGKRFNAQRAARRALKNPEAVEGVDFSTFKNKAGEWEWSTSRHIPEKKPAAKGSHLKVVGGTESKPAKAAKKGRKIKPKGQEIAPKPRGAWAKVASEAAARGQLPEPPNFEAETHRPHRKKLAEVVNMAERGDIDALMGLKINPTSTSPKAIQRYVNLAVQALKVQRADGRMLTQMKPEEWEEQQIRAAKAFVACKFLGRGNYDRRDGFTSAEQAERAAVEMGNRSMVYAITDKGREVLVGGVQAGAFERTKSAVAALEGKAA